MNDHRFREEISSVEFRVDMNQGSVVIAKAKVLLVRSLGVSTMKQDQSTAKEDGNSCGGSSGYRTRCPIRFKECTKARGDNPGGKEA